MPAPKKRKIKRIIWITLAAGFIVLNIIAFLHAYAFTHFNQNDAARTKGPEHLSLGKKIKTLITGVSNPRPQTKHPAPEIYRTVKLQSNYTIECWYAEKPDTAQNDPKVKDAIAIFHGYGGEKSSMLDKAAIFNSSLYIH